MSIMDGDDDDDDGSKRYELSISCQNEDLVECKWQSWSCCRIWCKDVRSHSCWSTRPLLYCRFKIYFYILSYILSQNLVFIGIDFSFKRHVSFRWIKYEPILVGKISTACSWRFSQKMLELFRFNEIDYFKHSKAFDFIMIIMMMMMMMMIIIIITIIIITTTIIIILTMFHNRNNCFLGLQRSRSRAKQPEAFPVRRHGPQRRDHGPVRVRQVLGNPQHLLLCSPTGKDEMSLTFHVVVVVKLAILGRSLAVVAFSYKFALFCGAVCCFWCHECHIDDIVCDLIVFLCQCFQAVSLSDFCCVLCHPIFAIPSVVFSSTRDGC